MDEYPITYTNTLWTYSQYCELPSDGRVYQVLAGVLYMIPSPNFYHQRASNNLSALLTVFVKAEKAGEIVCAPFDVILTPTDVVQPDILFVSEERSEIIKDRGVVEAPDMVVEIISPSTKTIDEELKLALYEKHGVREYLLVYPQDRKIVQYCLEGGKYRRVGIFAQSDEMALKTLELAVPVGEVFTK